MDSSVWIDFFNRSPGRPGRELRRMIQDGEPFALSGLIVAEVLQGLTSNIAEIDDFLSQWELLEPSGTATYREAAAIFRFARSRGVTVTTIDCMIAATALEHGATIFSIDKDFLRIARLTGLALHGG